ncbi:MAG: hypothetical protein Q4D79_05825 [Propionibacteriaceae bacterium]|nr:hypothetical protein [Propionibacteriaceae bacterium]
MGLWVVHHDALGVDAENSHEVVGPDRPVSLALMPEQPHFKRANEYWAVGRQAPQGS